MQTLCSDCRQMVLNAHRVHVPPCLPAYNLYMGGVDNKGHYTVKFILCTIFPLCQCMGKILFCEK